MSKQRFRSLLDRHLSLDSIRWLCRFAPFLFYIVSVLLWGFDNCYCFSDIHHVVFTPFCNDNIVFFYFHWKLILCVSLILEGKGHFILMSRFLCWCFFRVSLDLILGIVAEFGKFHNFLGFVSQTVIEWKIVRDFASNGKKLWSFQNFGLRVWNYLYLEIA